MYPILEYSGEQKSIKHGKEFPLFGSKTYTQKQQDSNDCTENEQERWSVWKTLSPFARSISVTRIKWMIQEAFVSKRKINVAK